MGIFKAKFRKYWCDRYSEYTEIRTSSIDEILEYVYKTDKESPYPRASNFWCKCGYEGSLWLEQITYFKGDGSDEIIIFSR